MTAQDSTLYRCPIATETCHCPHDKPHLKERLCEWACNSTLGEQACEPVVSPTPSKSKTEHYDDRIAYLGDEYEDRGQPLIDEIVMGEADVHFEMLSDNSAYMILRNGKHYWHLSIYHKGKSPLRVVMYEDESDNPEMLKRS